MENTSVASNICNNNFTTSSSENQNLQEYLDQSRDVALKIINIIFGAIGIIDNLFVVIVFALYVKIRNKTMNILMVYQSVVDIGASFFLLLHAVVKVDGTGLKRDSSYDQFVCLVWFGRQPFMYFLTGSIYGVLLLTLDRYFAVLYPVWYKNNLKIRKRLVFSGILILWIVLTALQIFMTSMSTDIIDGTCMAWAAYRSYAVEKAVLSLSIVITYLLPLMMIVFGYSRIVYVLKHKVSHTGVSVISKAGRNAVVTSLMVCCGFIICFSPAQIIDIMNLCGAHVEYGSRYQLTIVLLLTNGFINPFIYGAKYREFQLAVRRLMQTLIGNQRHQSQVSAIA